MLKGIPCEQLFALVLEIKNQKRAVEAEARKKREARALQKLAKARPSRIPPLRIQFTRAGIEWRRCQHAVCMARPHKAPRHSGQAEP